MKEFKCFECGRYLGEMLKGKLHKDAVVVCKSCTESYKTYKSLAEYNKKGNAGDLGGFKDIFKGMGMK